MVVYWDTLLLVVFIALLPMVWYVQIIWKKDPSPVVFALVVIAVAYFLVKPPDPF